MNMEQLAYLCDLHESGSMTATAEKFYISHQGVSKSIRSLENELSTTLINRSSKGVSLTKEGLFVAEKAKKMLAEYDAIRQHFPESYKKTVQGNLAISSNSRIIDTYLNTILSSFFKRYPQVRINIKNVSIDDVLQLLSSGTVDIGFSSFRDTDLSNTKVQAKFHELNITFETFSKEEIFACIPKSMYPKNAAFYSKELYPELPVVSYNYGFTFFGRKSVLNYEINSIEVQRNMIENKLAIGMVTNREFEQFYAKKKKFALMPLNPPVYFHFGYLTSTQIPLPQAAEVFLQFFNQHFSHQHQA